MFVTSVGKLLVRKHTFCAIRKFTLKKNHGRIKMVTVQQIMTHSLLSVINHPQVKPTIVTNVARVLTKPFISLYIRRPILRNATNVPNARHPSTPTDTSSNIRKFMLHR